MTDMDQFFIGRPLNPTWPGFPNFDIKTFNEDRPGLILWPLLNISCLCEQYVKYGRVTDSMWLVVAFQLFYSADCQWFEVCSLSSRFRILVSARDENSADER